MKELKGNVWDVYAEYDALCITTNGWVSPKTGKAVMGRGIAREISVRSAETPKLLAAHIKDNGNCVGGIGFYKGVHILSYPVKPVNVVVNHDKSNVVPHMRDKFKVLDTAPGWSAVAELTIIAESAKQLVSFMDKHDIKTVLLPRPGCGAGTLSWSSVKGVLEVYLDDRVTVISF